MTCSWSARPNPARGPDSGIDAPTTMSSAARLLSGTKAMAGATRARKASEGELGMVRVSGRQGLGYRWLVNRRIQRVLVVSRPARVLLPWAGSVDDLGHRSCIPCARPAQTVCTVGNGRVRTTMLARQFAQRQWPLAVVLLDGRPVDVEATDAPSSLKQADAGCAAVCAHGWFPVAARCKDLITTRRCARRRPWCGVRLQRAWIAALGRRFGRDQHPVVHHVLVPLHL
jgi:hypothetical protein